MVVQFEKYFEQETIPFERIYYFHGCQGKGIRNFSASFICFRNVLFFKLVAREQSGNKSQSLPVIFISIQGFPYFGIRIGKIQIRNKFGLELHRINAKGSEIFRGYSYLISISRTNCRKHPLNL